MKTLLSIAVLAMMSINAYSQSQHLKSVENNSGCDITITLYYYDADCINEPGWNQTYTISSGNFATATAPSGYEFMYAVVTNARCSSGTSITVGAPSSCGACNPGHPSNVTADLIGCDETCEGVEVTWHCDTHLMIE